MKCEITGKECRNLDKCLDVALNKFNCFKKKQNIAEEIDNIQKSFMHEIEILFKDKKNKAIMFESLQPDLQGVFNRTTTLLGPKLTPAILRLYADMLDKINNLGESMKKEEK